MTDRPLILDGKGLAGRLLEDIARETTDFTGRFGRPPGLAVVSVGEDPASKIYVVGKAKSCARAGIVNRRKAARRQNTGSTLRFDLFPFIYDSFPN